MAAASFGYFVFFETTQGATFGKQWLSLAVTTPTGGTTISTDASLRRNWWMLLGVLQIIPLLGLIASIASLVIVIVIAVTISSDPQRQGFHDKMASTVVVDRAPTYATGAPPPPPPT